MRHRRNIVAKPVNNDNNNNDAFADPRRLVCQLTNRNVYRR